MNLALEATGGCTTLAIVAAWLIVALIFLEFIAIIALIILETLSNNFFNHDFLLLPNLAHSMLAVYCTATTLQITT